VETSDDEAAEGAMLAIGESASIDVNDEIRIVRKRESEAEVLVSYIHRATGEAVFEGTASDADGLQFSYIDPFFWEISLNGARTSRATIERLIEGEFLMRMDLEGRRILFKTRTEGQA
jgi:hypothetical protein